ncbi:nucleotidyltransferase domain-containing protein [Virgibacillus ndiopensis]|uniref:nucleotidyltransferase domain-containing protein n=1 Tax=Virgibacillus ndiopensis TaxID=2004408 RepID=UPI000C080B98|nr:nucleotidyltransferase domain-containing protein [Virgibacillus ndiopensis]
MGFVSRHYKRDSELPKHRSKLLENALNDLSNDENVLGIYQSGSLAKGNFDNYSDIDLHIIVTPETKRDFIKNKRDRSKKWGDVLFNEGSNTSSVIVTHYECFVKMDTWYQSPAELQPSIWLQGVYAHYDKHNIISKVIKESVKLAYRPTQEEVEFWKGKVFAFVHETYRSVMREEMYYALANLDRVRWLIAYGWYMEMEKHLESSYGVWSKIEGERSQLNKWQLSLLVNWNCDRDSVNIMETMKSMIPEFLRINKYLSKLVGIDENEEYCNKIIAMAL